MSAPCEGGCGCYGAAVKAAQPGASCPLRWTPPLDWRPPGPLPAMVTWTLPRGRWWVEPDTDYVGTRDGLRWPRTITGNLLATAWSYWGDGALLRDGMADLIAWRLGVLEDDWSAR